MGGMWSELTKRKLTAAYAMNGFGESKNLSMGIVAVNIVL